MTIKTRVSGKSESNDRITVMNQDDEEVATMVVASGTVATLEVETKKGHYITKPTGWSSKK